MGITGNLLGGQVTKLKISRKRVGEHMRKAEPGKLSCPQCIIGHIGT